MKTLAERRPLHVPAHVAGYIDELESDVDKLVTALGDLIVADNSTRLMRIVQAKKLLTELGFVERVRK